MNKNTFSEALSTVEIGKVVDFDLQKDNVYPMDLTANNLELTDECLNDADLFSQYVASLLKANDARYAMGGYNEHRTIYNRSRHFDAAAGAPRRLHLGTDIWGPVGTSVYNFLDGYVHGFARNDTFGDYGATIIIKYSLNGMEFFGLYGHLSASSLTDLAEGQRIEKGTCFAQFGAKNENGNWAPHLHFQLILDLQGNKTDYPGVCAFDERELYLANCPDPMLILNSTFYNA